MKLEDYDAENDVTAGQQNTATTPSSKMQNKLKKEMAAHAAEALAMVAGEGGTSSVLEEKVRRLR